MVSKIINRSKTLYYKLKYKATLKMDNKIIFPKNTDILINDGNIEIGKKFVAGPGLRLVAVRGGNISIADNVAFNYSVRMVAHKSIFVGEGCSLGPNVMIYDHDHDYDGKSFSRQEFKVAPVIIEKNCWIGANSIILRGTHIGEGCIIGAGTIVKGIIPPHSLVTNSRELKVVSINKD